MTTTRRRSSVGSAAASAAAADPPAASTPTSVRSSSRRRTSVARRDSPGGLDLGLLGRPSVGGGGGGGGGDSTPNSVGGRAARAFRFFEDEDEEGGVLVLGGWRVRPLHVMGSLFLLVLFAVLTLLTLYPGVSEGLSKDLSFTGPKRVGRGGAGQRGNISMDECVPPSFPPFPFLACLSVPCPPLSFIPHSPTYSTQTPTPQHRRARGEP